MLHSKSSPATGSSGIKSVTAWFCYSIIACLSAMTQIACTRTGANCDCSPGSRKNSPLFRIASALGNSGELDLLTHEANNRRRSGNSHYGRHIPSQTGILLIEPDNDRVGYVTQFLSADRLDAHYLTRQL